MVKKDMDNKMPLELSHNFIGKVFVFPNDWPMALIMILRDITVTS